MTRRGIALPVALLVVLLGGVLVVAGVGAAVAELRAGSAWAEMRRADDLAASSLADINVESLASLDTMPAGGVIPLAGADSLLRLGAELGLVRARAGSRVGEARVELLVKRLPDDVSWVPISVRQLVHPIP